MIKTPDRELSGVLCIPTVRHDTGKHRLCLSQLQAAVKICDIGTFASAAVNSAFET